MKNIMFVFMFVLCISIYSQSQTIIEIQGGANLANLSDPGNLVPGGVWKTRTGFIGGVATVIKMSDKVYINPGVRYAQKGTKSEWTSPMTGDVKASVMNNYLEVPVYLKYEFANIGSQLYAIGGPSFAYLVSSTLEGDMQLLGHSSVDSKKDYKSYDITFDLGLSSTTLINEQISFLASAMYSFGFVKVSKLGSNEATRDVKLLVGLSYILQ